MRMENGRATGYRELCLTEMACESFRRLEGGAGPFVQVEVEG